MVTKPVVRVAVLSVLVTEMVAREAALESGLLVTDDEAAKPATKAPDRIF